MMERDAVANRMSYFTGGPLRGTLTLQRYTTQGIVRNKAVSFLMGQGSVRTGIKGLGSLDTPGKI